MGVCLEVDVALEYDAVCAKHGGYWSFQWCLGCSEENEGWLQRSLARSRAVVTVPVMDDVVTTESVMEMCEALQGFIQRLVEQEGRGPHRAYRLGFFRTAGREVGHAKDLLAEAYAFEEDE